MAKSVKNKIDVFLDEKIIPENLETIVGDRFGKYSKYIIQDRALPDVRDGLKPVQRRILYAMHALGMGSTKPYKKSARIVGEVIGKYHPHGDTSVYDAMVRMSQTWKMGTLLIDMHGNNGSIDNDPAAAMRYTEARLSVYAEQLLKDIDKRTVNFIPNFDDEEYEPVVLPAKFPNLLVNGGMGMATGYATNIPPHNLNEVIEAVIHKIRHPEATIEDLAKIIKGPDFPTGAIVEGTDEIRKAFETGKGRIIIKSKVEVKDTSLIVTEIPYEVNKSELVRKIDEIRLKKKIDGIIEVRDESDREGLRIVIDLKKEISSKVVLAYLLKNTDLSVAFNYNVVAIDQKSPKQLSLNDLLNSYILHQKEVIRNRSNFELQRAEKRSHIVDGFLKMVEILDDVIIAIRASYGKKDSIDKLMSLFNFTEIQADAIVSLQLYRLSSTDVEEMKKENLDLQKQINQLSKILSNELVLENVIVSELSELSASLPQPRRSEIKDEIRKLEIDEQELIQNENVMVVLSKDGYIKRTSMKSYQATPGNTGLKQNDVVLKQQEVNTRDTLLIFTTLGNYINIPVYKVPDMKWRDLGEFIGVFAPLKDSEDVLDMITIDSFEDEKMILLANQQGAIKQVTLSEFQQIRLNKTYNCMPASKINHLVSVDIKESYDTSVTMASKNGYVVKYDITDIPAQSLSAKGVKGINLRDDDLIGARYTNSISKDEILLLTNRGAIKRCFTSTIDISHRPAKGKLFLKSVKTNPYQFIGFISENVFRLKDYITFRIILKDGEFIIPGNDLKPDKYEHGVPILEKEDCPVDFKMDKNQPYLVNQSLMKLFKEEVQTDELDESEEEVETEDVMLELEKILSSRADFVPQERPVLKAKLEIEEKEEEEEDDDSIIVQQTLF
ncbi:MAG: DNA topoisomerase IV subunit A [Firmicutes bacterium]|nr:DNA topoisomerase IV subunit A [Bacillota bacterium]